MQVYSATNDTGSVNNNSASSIKESFLKLLVAQLKNQDPLTPIDNQNFTTQLAQLTQTESLENIKEIQKNNLNINAGFMVGMNVSGTKEDGTYIEGKIIGVLTSEDGPLFITENGNLITKEILKITK